MQEEPLRKFTLPEINVNCLQKIVTHNTVRFVNLLSGRHDPVRKIPSFDPKGYTSARQIGCHQNDKMVEPGGNKENNGIDMQPVNDRLKIYSGLDKISKVSLSKSNKNSEPCLEKCSVAPRSDNSEKIEDDKNRTIKVESSSAVPLVDNKTLFLKKSISSLSSLCDAVNNKETTIGVNKANKKGDFVNSSDIQKYGENSEDFIDCEQGKGNEESKKSQAIVILEKADEEIINLDEEEINESKEKNSEEPFCVIANVFGNADETFAACTDEDSSDSPTVITPKKTTDITKIKGWRRKQFFVEKPTTVEFYQYEKGFMKKRIRVEKLEKEELNEEPENLDNAFVCDSLDEFLEQEANLKIDYEIPHLYAEYGIKLTSEELLSKPNMSEKDYNEVGTRYCVNLKHQRNDLTLLSCEENCTEKREKRRCDDDLESKPPNKMIKIDKKNKKSIEMEGKSTSEYQPIKMQKQISLLKSFYQSPKVKEEKCLPVANKSRVFALPSGMSFACKLLGLVVYPGPFRPLHSVVQKHLHKLRSYRTKIDRNWASFAASAVRIKWQNRYLCRKIMPVYCTAKAGECSSVFGVEEVEKEVKETEKKEEKEVEEIEKKEEKEVEEIEKQEKKEVKETEKKEEKEVEEIEKKAEKEEEEIEKEVEEVVGFLVKTVCAADSCSIFHHAACKNELKCVEKSEVKKPVDDPHGEREEKNWNLKPCRVLLDKIIMYEGVEIWCMDHNCYNCRLCGYSDGNILKDLRNFLKRQISDIEYDRSMISNNVITCLVETDGPDEPDIVLELDKESSSLVSSVKAPSLSSFFDRRLANLLEKKLRKVAFDDDVVLNLTKLVCRTSKSLELIKLNFVKQSFLAGGVHLFWKPAREGTRSRAFLTFSKTSPEPGSILIGQTETPLLDLPKVLSDILSPERDFEIDEYVILYGKGNRWEIHGSLNLALNKKDGVTNNWEVDQVFIPVSLPELKEMQKVAVHILKTRATKWWVLDLSQRFDELLWNVGPETIRVGQNHLLSVVKSKFVGYFVIKKQKNRCYGGYVLNGTYPFLLIGPYYTFEKCSLSLKTKEKKTSFEYGTAENGAKYGSLKFFIDSVVAAVEPGKKLEGLWLYDKTTVNSACYLEILSTNLDSFPKSEYSVEKEHGYALSDLSDSTPSPQKSLTPTANCSGKEDVYLYFDVFELGYVAGKLRPDESVVINHPLKPGTRIRSHKIGAFFVSILKRRIQCIPKDFVPQWFITKNKEDLKNRLPFNKFYLGGAYILCKNGVLPMLKITESKIKEYGLKKRDVLKAVWGCSVIQEVTALKYLKAVVRPEAEGNVPMDQVLEAAVKVIRDLDEKSKEIEEIKAEVVKTKLGLWKKYLRLINERVESNDEKLNFLISFLHPKSKQRELSEDVKVLLQNYILGGEFPGKLNEKLKMRKSFGEKIKIREFEKNLNCVYRLRNRKLPGPKGVAKADLRKKFKLFDWIILKRLAKIYRLYTSMNKGNKSSNFTNYRQAMRKLSC